MNTAALISDCAVVPEFSDYLLNYGYIIVGAYGCHEFYGIFSAFWVTVPIFTIDAAVIYKFPCSVAVITHSIWIIRSADMGVCGLKIFRSRLGCLLSCQSGKLYFDPVFLILQRIISPPAEGVADFSAAHSAIYFIYHPQNRTARPCAAELSHRDSTAHYRICTNTLRAVGSV